MSDRLDDDTEAAIVAAVNVLEVLRVEGDLRRAHLSSAIRAAIVNDRAREMLATDDTVARAARAYIEHTPLAGDAVLGQDYEEEIHESMRAALIEVGFRTP